VSTNDDPNAGGVNPNGGAGGTNNDPNANGQNPQGGQSGDVQRLKEHADKLLAEKKQEQEKRKALEDALSAFGITDFSGDLKQKLADILKNKDEEAGKAKGENAILLERMAALENDNKAQREARISAQLERQLIDSLDEAGVLPSARELLIPKIKQGLTQDGESFKRVDGDKIFSVSDYAKSVASQFPQLIAANTQNRQGFNFGQPARQNQQTSAADLLKAGKPVQAFGAIAAQRLKKG
jgi:hypothetical protein